MLRLLPKKPMIIGFFYALAACFVWGLIFVIPHFLGDFSAIEIALGRYFSYGVLSTFLLFRKGLQTPKTIPMKAWKSAFLFSLFSNIFYYFGVVIGLRYATAPVTVLILGLCPILVSFYGNWQVKENSNRSLILPCFAMLCGMVLVNVSEIDWSFTNYAPQDYLLGLGCATAALVSWSWYAVHNARFLKLNPDVPRTSWATLMGATTFVWVLIAGIILGGFGDSEVLDFAKFTSLTPSSLRYFGAIAVLGVVCSWMGCYFWNQASSSLPLSLMGAFIIFETIFGLFFVYLVEWRTPSLVEFLGISLMLLGITGSIFLFRKKSPSSV